MDHSTLLADRLKRQVYDAKRYLLELSYDHINPNRHKDNIVHPREHCLLAAGKDFGTVRGKINHYDSIMDYFSEQQQKHQDKVEIR